MQRIYIIYICIYVCELQMCFSFCIRAYKSNLSVYINSSNPLTSIAYKAAKCKYALIAINRRNDISDVFDVGFLVQLFIPLVSLFRFNFATVQCVFVRVVSERSDLFVFDVWNMSTEWQMDLLCCVSYLWWRVNVEIFELICLDLLCECWD